MRMNFVSSLIDVNLPLALDASVLISLHASTYGGQILSTIPNKIIVPKIVATECERGPDKTFLQDLARKGVLEIHDLTDDEYELFGKIASTLDDGESATLAISISRAFLPVIDERKGRTYARSLISSLEPGWTFDLIRHPAVTAALGENDSVRALFLALRESHMRVSDEHVDKVIALIGEEKARQCICLPNYKKRFPKKSE